MRKDDIYLTILKTIIAKIESTKLDWVVIGSLASKLQGCTIHPRDIDILVKDPKSVAILADKFSKYFKKESQHESITEEGEEWWSTEAKPVDESIDQWGFKWTFARWEMVRYKVEIAHIAPPAGKELFTKGIWEAGPDVWDYIITVNKSGYSIPVVPLEIQLETNLGRGLSERVDDIISVMKKKGYNKELVKKALDPSRYSTFEEKIKS